MVNIKDHVEHCFSNEDGQIIYDLIAPLILKREQVTVSFLGIPSTTTSFINSAFISLLDYIDYESVKVSLKVVDSNTHINRLIKDRFKSATRH